ncbi:MAG: regulator, partial [Burkholderiaceae bacterium]|nr:regulator [Burkholderiaceae bacterium]
TDIQMRWHRLPLNEAREADGRPTVNGLWLYGGGLWQPLAARPFAAVAADDPTVRGWALASGLDPAAVACADALPPGAADAETLLYRDDLAAAFQAQDWAAWRTAFETLAAALDGFLARAFACGHREVTLLLAGRGHLRAVALRAGDRLRFWRATPTARLFAEDAP